MVHKYLLPMKKKSDQPTPSFPFVIFAECSPVPPAQLHPKNSYYSIYSIS